MKLGLLILAITFTNVITGCSKKKSSKPSSSEPTGNLILVPDVQAINLNDLGSSQASGLTSNETNCSSSEGRGVFSYALGGACSLSPLVSQVLLGGPSGDYDNDGELTCADYDYAQEKKLDSGILLALMCESVFRAKSNVTKMLFDSEGEGFLGISFEAFDTSSSAVGSWSSGNDASYPANVRLYTGASIESLSGLVAMNLKDRANGVVWVNAGADNFSAKISFSSPTDATNCKSSPSKTNCYYQDIRIYTPSGLGGGAPSGIHMQIWVDNKTEPSFYAIEGRYTYTASQADTIFADFTPFKDLRDLYFKTVKVDSNLWGIFDFKGENSANIVYPTTGQDFLALLRNPAGVCQDLASSTRDNISGTCADSMKNLSIFEGSTTFAKITADPSTEVDFTTAKPTETGIFQTP